MEDNTLYIKTDDGKEIKWRIIYNCFESLFDEYEELADTVEAIVVSNS
jgi:hypothetical protein